MVRPTRVIALEEHYYDDELARLFPGANSSMRGTELGQRLYDVDALRLREMDEAGIDMQVLSHGAPATQRLDAQTAIRVARSVNDRLAETVRSNPSRFAAFAALPTPDPRAAADELERTVTKLGFKGAMIHGLTNGVFFDDKRFWPICERAEALDVPIYLHPAIPHPDVVKVYYQDYLKEHPGLLTAAWGFTVETATQGIRMVLSGVFEAYPRLKCILGHLGESLPFSLWRINQALSRPKPMRTSFRDVFCEHFWITTSGNFSTPALLCSMMEIGVDRILFSVDYPFEHSVQGLQWMKEVHLSEEDRAKILNGNASRLLKL